MSKISKRLRDMSSESRVVRWEFLLESAKEIESLEDENKLLKAKVKTLEEKSNPYLKNYADAVDGHYCIARKRDDGYTEYWDVRNSKWASFGCLFDLTNNNSDKG